MEFQFLDISNIFTILLLIFILWKLAKRESTPKLPPGPWKIPVIGNIHQLISSSPHQTLRNLSIKFGPLMHLQLGEISTIVVSSPEIAGEIMKDHDITFAQRPYSLTASIITYNGCDIGFSPYGSYWRQIRKIATIELLSANRVQSFRSVREEEVSDLIREIYLHKTTPINLSEKIYSLTYGITSRVVFGGGCNDQEEFISLISEISELLGGVPISDMFPSMGFLPVITGMKAKVESLHQRVDRILEKIVNEHKERKARTHEEEKEDLVDVLLRLQEKGDLDCPLTANSVKAVIQDVFSGGSETSSTVVEWAMSELLRNPRVMKKVQAEVREIFSGKGNVNETSIHDLKYLKLVVMETLRLHPPVPFLVPRECGETCMVGGYEIPIKTRVIINAWALGRDPKYWDEVERFYPERFLGNPISYKGTDFKYIPFGAGRRMCPGATFAMANIELPLAQFLYHFDWKIPNGNNPEHLDMTEKFGLSMKRKRDLVLVPIPYHPLPID